VRKRVKKPICGRQITKWEGSTLEFSATPATLYQIDEMKWLAEHGTDVIVATKSFGNVLISRTEWDDNAEEIPD
jgi:hypothetical protein